MSESSEFARLAELLISRQDQQQRQIDLLAERAEKTDQVLSTFGQVQQALINQLELIYNEQQQFNRQQSEFNQRQDDFNIIFLEELRKLNNSVSGRYEQYAAVLAQHEARLKKLEDSANGQQSAA